MLSLWCFWNGLFACLSCSIFLDEQKADGDDIDNRAGFVVCFIQPKKASPQGSTTVSLPLRFLLTLHCTAFNFEPCSQTSLRFHKVLQQGSPSTQKARTQNEAGCSCTFRLSVRESCSARSNSANHHLSATLKERKNE